MSHGALRSCMIPGLAGEHSYPEGCLWKTKTTKYLQQYVNSIIYQKRKGWKLLWNIFLIKLNTAHSIFCGFCSFETTVRCPVLQQHASTAPPSKFAVQCTPALLSWLSYVRFPQLFLFEVPRQTGGNRKVLYREKKVHQKVHQRSSPKSSPKKFTN